MLHAPYLLRLAFPEYRLPCNLPANRLPARLRPAWVATGGAVRLNAADCNLYL